MLGNPIKNGCKNLYLFPKPYRITFILKSYVMSSSCCGPVNPSTPTFPNINFTKATRNLLFISKITKKWLQESLFPLLFLWYDLEIIFKSFSYLTSLYCRDPVNPSTPAFGNIYIIETTINLIVACKFHQKWLKESLFVP